MFGRNIEDGESVRAIDNALSCPACGAYRVSFRGHFKPLGFAVRCNNCHFEGGVSPSKDESVRLWNELERTR